MSLSLRSLAVALLCALLAPALAARAQQAPAAGSSQQSLLVLPFAPLNGQVPERAGLYVANQVAREVGNIGTIQSSVLNVDPDEAGDGALSAARNAVSEAQKMVAQRRFGAAADSWKRAIEKFDEAAGRLVDVAELSDAHVEYAVVLYAIGRDEEGAKELANAISLTPFRTFAREGTSPLFSATVKRIRDQVLDPKAKRAAILFESRPSGAKVLLDGEVVADGEAGWRTPYTYKELPPGKHHWRMLFSSSEPAGGVLFLERGATITVKSGLVGKGEVARINSILISNKVTPEVVDAVRSLAEREKSELVLFGALYAYEELQQPTLSFDAYVYSTKTNAVARLKRKTFDQELIGAGMAMYEVATELSSKLEEFGKGETLPSTINGSMLPEGAIGKRERLFKMPSELEAEGQEVGPAKPASGPAQRRGPVGPGGKKGSAIKLNERER